MGIKIIDVKAVGLCSKCRKEGDKILKYKDGTIIPDKDISCICELFDSCGTEKLIKKMDIKKLLEKAREFNGMIKTPEDLLNHLQRVQTCCGCGLSYYDKICPECQKKIDNTQTAENKLEDKDGER